MTTHDFPSGGTFTVREAQDVPEKLRRPVSDLLMEQFDTDDDEGDGTLARAQRLAMMKKQATIDDLFAVAMLVKWDRELPITAESMGELSKRDYRAVLTVIGPHILEMMPDFGPTPDEDSPTPP